jgi:hypothetical protein
MFVISLLLLLLLFFFFYSGLHTCRADALPVEFYHSPVHFAEVILEMGAYNLFAWAGLEQESSQS